MKKLTIGIIIGLMLGLSTNALGAIGDTVSAVFAEFGYKVNGEAKTLDAPVLVYEGMSYVRTTQIGNMLGYDVTYRADSRTIEFNNPEPIIAPIEQKLTPISQPIAEPISEPTTQTPVETVETPTAPVVVKPEPVVEVPDNTAACKAINHDYSYQIVMVGYEGGAVGPKKLKVLLLEYERDQALKATGC